ncbi:unknown [Candidatus Apopatosoma intestinale]|nr:unknown [Candidatus Apopatosoma intestinale]
MKEIFESAVIELIILQDDDIIRTSSLDSTDKGIELPDLPV